MSKKESEYFVNGEKNLLLWRQISGEVYSVLSEFDKQFHVYIPRYTSIPFNIDNLTALPVIREKLYVPNGDYLMRLADNDGSHTLRIFQTVDNIESGQICLQSSKEDFSMFYDNVGVHFSLFGNDRLGTGSFTYGDCKHMAYNFIDSARENAVDFIKEVTFHSSIQLA